MTWEEGTWAAWLYDLLQPQVQQVVVCNPRRNALLKEGSKSDKVDARKLAELLRTGMLRPVYHGENGLRTLRELARSYQTISQDLTRVMNRLKALYRGWGIPCAGTQVYAPRELAVLLLQFLQSLRLVHLQPAVLLSPAVERLHCDLGFFAGLWGGFSVRDAYFDLPQHRHDLLWFVPLDRHGVKATYKPDLAARDFKRAAQVVEKYGKQKEPVKLSPSALPSAPSTPVPTAGAPLPPYESMPSSVFLERHALIDSKGRWTPRGRAWLKTRPPIAAVPVVTPMVKEVTPFRKQEKELAIPYEQTDAGYNALGAYWKENKKEPPENFDLKQWFADHRKKSA